MKHDFRALKCIRSSFTLHMGALAAAIACDLGGPGAYAFQIDTGNSDIKLRWDNTLKYSTAWRLKSPLSKLISDTNYDDGDRNFSKGLISNRTDLLSELDIQYGNFGARASGAAWYDDVYNKSNDNNSPDTVNQLSRAYDEFPSATRDLHGRKGELLDAFVFGRFDLMGDSRATFRLGRHALLYGESLFFGSNGIAGGQAPMDVIKSQSVPNTQYKELVRPTQQISGQLQINPRLSIGAYYQLRWEKQRLPASGSYFSTLDILGDGGEIMRFGGPFNATRGRDIKAKDSGQGGLQVRFRIGETDYGLYAIQFHDKGPQLYLRGALPGTPPGVDLPAEYAWVYPENIQAYGASASHTFGEFNIAGEVSVRRNQPLASDAQVDLLGTGNNDSNPLYAVGNTAHAQVSWMATLAPNFLANETDFSGEVAWNRTTSITRNPDALNPNADRDAWNIRMVYEPRYRQVFPGTDLSIPLGIGYGLGNSSALGTAFLGNHVGDVSIGIAGSYLQVWRFSANYTHFIGPKGLASEDGHGSFKQTLKDRDFLSLSVNRTF
ncbi:conserved exported protein of unknown function [Pseudomonas sp. JV551A1]|uniref:DUF1302 domain-containing protein n=1 Tax=Pseudomonas inefficax TaxID=2078786 RepID=A0AAQ1SUI0_9PSED|nr:MULTISPECIES: DUF1302 domain-containing protein [Pseudomonas]SPO54604.1 conserved exported protein of unknown function [Pseudomonas sp. JV551A1]SPO62115.1 conserved exported protein of unknown function [Pseudomonas inefficax]